MPPEAYVDADAGSTLLSQTHEGDRLVVHLRGELDLSCRDQLARELDGMLVATAGATLQLDLAEVTFLDAATLGVLARVSVRARERGTAIVVSSLQPLHRRIFEIAPCGSVVVED